MKQSEKQIVSVGSRCLLEYRHLFDASELDRIKLPPKKIGPIPTDEGMMLTFYWPEQVEKDTVGGFKLKSGKGFITIEEVYINANGVGYEQFSHTYRFTSNEYEYLINHVPSDKDCRVLPYNFRFDLDPSHNKDNLLNHLQVLHSHPRFPTQETTLLDFLRIVDKACFKDKKTAYSTPFFSNHMI